MDTETYNGWANWETWNVMLWFNNEEPLYRAYRRQARHRGFNAKEAEAFVREMLPKGTPDMEDQAGAKCYAVVDWEAISEAFNEGNGDE